MDWVPFCLCVVVKSLMAQWRAASFTVCEDTRAGCFGMSLRKFVIKTRDCRGRLVVAKVPSHPVKHCGGPGISNLVMAGLPTRALDVHLANYPLECERKCIHFMVDVPEPASLPLS